jgi:hypothetical protein
MVRKQPSVVALRALLAKSGNQCAYPGCFAELVTADNLFVGELCHVAAAQPGGPRYDATSTDEERRAYSNLLFLCHPHHRRVDSDVSRFPSEWLRNIKASHESQFLRNPYTVDASVIFQVEREIQLYWQSIRERRASHPIADLAVRLDVDADGIAVFARLTDSITRVADVLDALARSDDELPSELRAFLERIGYESQSLDTIPYYDNPFDIRNWETHNIGARNVLRDLRATALYAELHYLIDRVKLGPDDIAAGNRLAQVQDAVTQVAASWGYAD